jgi:hypothetical protein
MCDVHGESYREPDQPHGHLGGGRLPGSLAERHGAHQHRAARARHPDAVTVDAAVQLAAAGMLRVEGFKGMQVVE